MYFPLVRGKQFELVALRELADSIPCKNLKPIIEPVRNNYSPLIKTINILNEKNIIPIVIINPSLGDFKNSNELINGILNDAQPHIDYIPCLKVKDFDSNLYSLLDSLEGEKAIYIYDKIDSQKMGLLNSANYSIVPRDAPIGALKHINNIVLMSDPFQKKKKNADYEEESYFSDIHTSYLNKELNAIGFGDYTIVGSDYSESGGPAYVVTIHMSYIDKNNFDSMSIKHFSSEDNNSLVDPGGKFREALDKFYIFDSKNPEVFDDTDGKKELLALHKKRQFSGLGIVKKIAIKHHIQTICNYIS
ncbi:sce7725 family protein [Yersinia enterocolitica]|uniref:sce7725 family protein n=1 Tax=Yersinia enterocolitica TaxID=630 RepID=UPI0030C2986E